MKRLYVIMGPICSGKTTMADMFSDGATVMYFDEMAHNTVHGKLDNVDSVINQVKEVVESTGDEDAVFVLDGWFSFFVHWWKDPNEKRVKGSLEKLEDSLHRCEVVPVVLYRNINRVMEDLDRLSLYKGGDKYVYAEYEKKIPMKYNMYTSESNKFIERKK